MLCFFFIQALLPLNATDINQSCTNGKLSIKKKKEGFSKTKAVTYVFKLHFPITAIFNKKKNQESSNINLISLCSHLLLFLLFFYTKGKVTSTNLVFNSDKCTFNK